MTFSLNSAGDCDYRHEAGGKEGGMGGCMDR